MPQLPAVQYHTLDKLVAKHELETAINDITSQLNKGDVTKIINSFLNGTRVRVNGMPYMKVKELGNILRTGSSGAHRVLVYQGMSDVVGASLIIEIEGEEYISGPSLLALVEARMAYTFGKTKEYLSLAKEIYNKIKNAEQVRNLKDLFIDAINQKRPLLKAERIKKYAIRACEFSGVFFNNANEVEFAHIQSVVTAPNQALDLDNGVIIMRAIHAELTRLQVHDYLGMRNYCIKKNYSLNWCNR